ncbi:hypothetical protein KCV01_g25409, partial [Aureobasidium melanogenum]
MTDASSALQKRRPSSSSAVSAQDGDHASNKRRFVLTDEPHQTLIDHKQSTVDEPSPLDVLAQAASLVARLPTSRRKRVVLNSPSPPPESRKFNLLTGLASHVDILLQITSYLPPQTLLNLYSVSAPFHYVMDS